MNPVPVTKKFILGGNAVFTVFNDKEHYTFRIVKKDSRPPYGETYFVSYLYGSDNENDYRYLGILNSNDFSIRLTKASSVNYESRIYRVIAWATRLVHQEKSFPPGYGCMTKGNCGRCGRRITAKDGVDPEGARYGFGPHCWKMINLPKKKEKANVSK